MDDLARYLAALIVASAVMWMLWRSWVKEADEFAEAQRRERALTALERISTQKSEGDDSEQPR